MRSLVAHTIADKLCGCSVEAHTAQCPRSLRTHGRGVFSSGSQSSLTLEAVRMQDLETYWLASTPFVAGEAISIADLSIIMELTQLRMLDGALKVSMCRSGLGACLHGNQTTSECTELLAHLRLLLCAAGHCWPGPVIVSGRLCLHICCLQAIKSLSAVQGPGMEEQLQPFPKVRAWMQKTKQATEPHFSAVHEMLHRATANAVQWKARSGGRPKL